MTTTLKPPMLQVLELITVSRLAIACHVSEQAVYKWIKKGYPPTGRCLAIEQATGGKLSRFDLLPPSFQAAKGSSMQLGTQES